MWFFFRGGKASNFFSVGIAFCLPPPKDSTRPQSPKSSGRCTYYYILSPRQAIGSSLICFSLENRALWSFSSPLISSPRNKEKIFFESEKTLRLKTKETNVWLFHCCEEGTVTLSGQEGSSALAQRKLGGLIRYFRDERHWGTSELAMFSSSLDIPSSLYFPE